MNSDRRSRQFTTRLAFALILLVSMPLARLGYVEQDRLRMIADIERRGGTVEEAQTAGGLSFLRGQIVTSVTLPHAQTADFDLEELRRFPNIKQLTLKDFHVRTPDGGELKSDGMVLNIDQFQNRSLNLLRPSNAP